MLVHRPVCSAALFQRKDCLSPLRSRTSERQLRADAGRAERRANRRQGCAVRPSLSQQQPPPPSRAPGFAAQPHTRSNVAGGKAGFMAAAGALREEAQAARDPQLVFIGDSITHSWTCGYPDIDRVWREEYAERGIRALALGIPGDQTESVLWRMKKKELDGLDPLAAVILIGTNNLGNGFSAQETAEGVAAVAREALRRLPRARVAVTLIMPRTPVPDDAYEGRWERWELVDEANRRIRSTLQSADGPLTEAERARVTAVDVTADFLEADGVRVRGSLMPDGLHPNAEGMRVWAKALRPFVDGAITVGRAAGGDAGGGGSK